MMKVRTAALINFFWLMVEINTDKWFAIINSSMFVVSFQLMLGSLVWDGCQGSNKLSASKHKML